MPSSHVIATLDVNSTVAYLVDIVVASPYTGLVVAQFAGCHAGPATTGTLIVALCTIIIVAAAGFHIDERVVHLCS